MEEALRLDERPMFVTFDVDLDDGLVKVRDLEKVVHDDRRGVRRAVGFRAEAVGVLRGQADAALVVARDLQLQCLAAVRDGVLDQDDLRGTDKRSGADDTMNIRSDVYKEMERDCGRNQVD